MTITKQRILDAAEKMFAFNGFDSTSLRDITAAAEVNLAAVNYHFQSKDALARAVLLRRIDAINRRRFELLGEYLRKTGDGIPKLEGLLEAFYRPAFELALTPSNRTLSAGRLIGRVYSEPERWLEIFEHHLKPVAERFIAELRRALPALPDQDFFWRFNFCIGALVQTMIHVQTLHRISNGKIDPEDCETAIRQVVAFVAAGFRAAVVGQGVRIS
jgi:AcrR family transcriptional regulator